MRWASLVVALSLPAAASAQDSGEALFNAYCAACHQTTGLGVKGAFPPLAGNSRVQGPAQDLATTVLVGRGGMPAFRNDLNDAQLAAVLSYLRGAWGNRGEVVSPADVAAARATADAAAQPVPLDAH